MGTQGVMIAALVRSAGLGLALAAVVCYAAGRAAAQMSPPPGVLTLPKPHAADQPAATAAPPQTAPVAPVQQVAPFAGPLAHPHPAGTSAAAAPANPAHRPKPTPVVQAPPNAHAQRPPPAKPAGTRPSVTPTVGPATPQPPVTDAARPPVDAKGSVTGMKLPRWASLRSDEVNLRVGPGTRFPIDWQYHRRDLPVQILRENDVWRLIEDQDGVKGWVHQATLTGRRDFVVRGAEAVMRRSAGDDAAPVARLKPGVVGRIRACDAGAAWCEVQVAGYTGWLKRAQFWGTDAAEAVGN
jgi:SH3-like domain-containing protein